MNLFYFNNRNSNMARCLTIKNIIYLLIGCRHFVIPIIIAVRSSYTNVIETALRSCLVLSMPIKAVCVLLVERTKAGVFGVSWFFGSHHFDFMYEGHVNVAILEDNLLCKLRRWLIIQVAVLFLEVAKSFSCTFVAFLLELWSHGHPLFIKAELH